MMKAALCFKAPAPSHSTLERKLDPPRLGHPASGEEKGGGLLVLEKSVTWKPALALFEA